MGPEWEIQEVSRVGAQGITSKSKLLALQMPRVCSRGLRADSGEDCRRKGGCAGPGSKVDAPELSSGPGWEIQEVSRVGAQGVTSNSKLLAREMPRLCSRGLRADAGESLKRLLSANETALIVGPFTTRTASAIALAPRGARQAEPNTKQCWFDCETRPTPYRADLSCRGVWE